MTDLDVSVVIPTFNMATHVRALWDTLVQAGVTARVREVVVVDDASTDGTAQALEGLRSTAAEGHKLRVVALATNQDRFLARLAGARAAEGAQLLFLDARVQLPGGFGPALAPVVERGETCCGVVDLDVSRNVFCLYWDRTHRVLFRRYYRDLSAGIVLTPANFGRYLKGTTVFVCERQRFIRACDRFEGQRVLSDDNRLLEELVAEAPIRIEPTLRVLWTPRENTREFLRRLWERGPSFVEYHVFTRRTGFFAAWLAGVVAVLGWLVLVPLAPPLAAAVAGGAVLLVAASTAVFARSPAELVRMAPLHVATVAVFGAAVLRGTGVNLARLFRGELSRVEKPI